MANVHTQQSPPFPLPFSSTAPSTPLNLTGFLTQNSIHVEGDAGSIHFSGTFNIYNNHLFSPATDLNGDNTNTLSPLRHTSSSHSTSYSSFVPNSFDEDGTDHFSSPQLSVHSDQLHGFETPEPAISSNAENGKACNHNSEMTIRTRLRSGTITPVSYYSFTRPRISGELSVKKMKCRRKLSWEGGDLMQRMVRRSVFPVRPCSSYSLFVMDKWDAVHSNSSFEETSKRLGELWSELPVDEKKLYVDMAAKDNSRCPYCRRLSSMFTEDWLEHPGFVNKNWRAMLS